EPDSTEKFPELPPEPYFTVKSVRRAPKIEDEDDDYLAEINPVRVTYGPVGRASRTASVSSRRSVSSIPRGARVQRASWSSKDFSQADLDRPNPVLVRRMSGGAWPGSVVKTNDGLSGQASGTPGPSRPMTPTKEAPEKEVDLDGVDEVEIEKDAKKGPEDSQ
ncbi:hypothetical protein PC116_g34829, partial [Phytophthora cactorum]